MVGTLSVVTLLLLAMASQSSTLKDCSGGCTVDDDDASALLQARASLEVQDTLEIEDALKPAARNKMLLQDDRQHKLAATQKMEQAMQSEVEKMVNKQGGSRIPTTVLDSMVAEMEAMRTNLVGEHKNFQQQIYDAIAAVETCNTDKDDTEGDTVAEAKGIMEQRNASHDTCRKAEVSAYNNKNISCELLATKSDKTCKAAPTCNCGSERQCDADSVLACQEMHRQWLASSNAALKAQKADCDTKTMTWSSKACECDTHQSNYELAFCSYAQHVDTMCSTLATCHTRAVAAYDSKVKLVGVEEKEIQALMASAKKIVCFLSVIRNSFADNITMKDYNVCKNLNVRTDTTYLNSTVEDMAIDTGVVAPQVPCQNVISWPGDGQWANNEYSQYNQDWLRETAVCGHKTTTTTTADPTQLTSTTIHSIPISYVMSTCDNKGGKWILFGDIDSTSSNFVGSDFTASATTSGLRKGDSVQVGTFNKGTAGSTSFSFDLGQLASSVDGSTFDLMIQYGNHDVYETCISGFSMTNGQFINNGRTAAGVTIGEHGMWGSTADKIDGYYATFCSYNGGCGSTGMDFWAFSSHGVYPNAAGSVPCGFYYRSEWKNCPSGDNGKRMRYYVRYSAKAEQ